jgi:hypothetical protein
MNLRMRVPFGFPDGLAHQAGAKSESPLKWTERFFFRCLKPPCYPGFRGGGKTHITEKGRFADNRRYPDVISPDIFGEY